MSGRRFDPQLMADFEEFMQQKSQLKQTRQPPAPMQERSAPVDIPKSKKAINCEKARAKRTEYAALRKEVEFLREIVKQRNLTESHMGASKSQNAPSQQNHSAPIQAPTNAYRRPEMVLNFD